MLRVNNSPSVQVPFRKRLLLIPGLKTSVLEGVGLGGREGVWEVDERECGVEMSEAREGERRFKQMPPSLFSHIAHSYSTTKADQFSWFPAPFWK